MLTASLFGLEAVSTKQAKETFGTCLLVQQTPLIVISACSVCWRKSCSIPMDGWQTKCSGATLFPPCPCLPAQGTGKQSLPRFSVGAALLDVVVRCSQRGDVASTPASAFLPLTLLFTFLLSCPGSTDILCHGWMLVPLFLEAEQS